ncbi:hypothetical protein G6514_000620 [Epicoccum nigrum]|nr:hypothetical protein G6514_000620 [Epicoccum nigrum]
MSDQPNYIRRANELLYLIIRVNAGFVADINTHYVEVQFNTVTITREDITQRVSLLILMRQHWNEAVSQHLTPVYLLNLQERTRNIESSLTVIETLAVDLESITRVRAPDGQFNVEIVMQSVDLYIPKEFLNEEQEREQILQQQHPSGQQQPQQQQQSQLQQGFDAEEQELFPGSSIAPVAHFPPPRVRSDPLAEDRAPITDEQRFGTEEQGYSTEEAEYGPGGQAYGAGEQ